MFLKSNDPKALSAWDAEMRGIPWSEDGSLIFNDPESMGMTVFAHFRASTRYFG